MKLPYEPVFEDPDAEHQIRLVFTDGHARMDELLQQASKLTDDLDAVTSNVLARLVVMLEHRTALFNEIIAKVDHENDVLEARTALFDEINRKLDELLARDP